MLQNEPYPTNYEPLLDAMGKERYVSSKRDGDLHILATVRLRKRDLCTIMYAKYAYSNRQLRFTHLRPLHSNSIMMIEDSSLCGGKRKLRSKLLTIRSQRHMWRSQRHVCTYFTTIQKADKKFKMLILVALLGGGQSSGEAGSRRSIDMASVSFRGMS